jgi:anti-anti-sigma factor
VVVARLAPEFDIASAVGIRDALLASLSNRDHGIVIDLQEVTFMDSAGINVLFEVAERLEARQQRVAVVLPERAIVRRVADLAGLGLRVAICESVEDAIAHIPPPDPG